MTPQDQSALNRKLCQIAPVIPVLVVSDAARAEGLAQALVAGGLPVLEVTLRTPAALDVIREMAKVAGGYVGAGTVITPDDVKRAKDAGASFAVSPGATEKLIRACEEVELPLLPGAATASEAMLLLEAGYTMGKFFPAEAAGGVKALKSLGGPLPQLSFCPTGGITLESAPSYLALPNVVCVGGSWIAPDADVADANWEAIRARAATAAGLVRG
ncbi:bifunctional 4-hydroxy-2-oxoglutarate aldolase/2-dehydro-3-deoxy-phosphogluconate aldolase [Paracoccus aminophilus]|nr:bifunctional 4-hydroxy-2-oxoglutarate aldolase/2-dehydro-3-deoxy-phosphogluconate aldolase [Paracoccus aminophilus]